MMNSPKQREDSSGTANRRSFQTRDNPLTKASRASPAVTDALGDAAGDRGGGGKEGGHRNQSETPTLLAGCVTLSKLLHLSGPQFAHPQYRKNHDSAFFTWLI